MKVYELKAEDLTGLGSPMGSERVNIPSNGKKF